MKTIWIAVYKDTISRKNIADNNISYVKVIRDFAKNIGKKGSRNITPHLTNFWTTILAMTRRIFTDMRKNTMQLLKLKIYDLKVR